MHSEYFYYYETHQDDWELNPNGETQHLLPKFKIPLRTNIEFLKKCKFCCSQAFVSLQFPYFRPLCFLNNLYFHLETYKWPYLYKKYEDKFIPQTGFIKYWFEIVGFRRFSMGFSLSMPGIVETFRSIGCENRRVHIFDVFWWLNKSTFDDRHVILACVTVVTSSAFPNCLTHCRDKNIATSVFEMLKCLCTIY